MPLLEICIMCVKKKPGEKCGCINWTAALRLPLRSAQLRKIGRLFLCFRQRNKRKVEEEEEEGWWWRGWGEAELWRNSPLIPQRLPELCCLLIGCPSFYHPSVQLMGVGDGASTKPGGAGRPAGRKRLVGWGGEKGESNCAFDIYWPLSSHLRRYRSQRGQTGGANSRSCSFLPLHVFPPF